MFRIEKFPWLVFVLGFTTALALAGVYFSSGNGLQAPFCEQLYCEEPVYPPFWLSVSFALLVMMGLLVLFQSNPDDYRVKRDIALLKSGFFGGIAFVAVAWLSIFVLDLYKR